MQKQENNDKIPWTEVMTLILGCFMAILDTSIVNTALPKMRASFGGNADSVEWVVTAYMLTSGVIIPLTGYLCDRFGNKRIYLVSLTIFTIGSVVCAMATSSSFLVFARVIQKRAIGLGLAMMPVSTAGVNTIPKQLAARASAINNVVRQIAGSFGIALITFVMMHRQIYHNAWVADTVNWSSSAAVRTINELQSAVIRDGISPSPVLARSCAEGLFGSIMQQKAYIASINDAIMVPAIIVAMVVPLGLLLNKNAVENENAKQHLQLIQPTLTKVP